jgi:phage terminase small subunit
MKKNSKIEDPQSPDKLNKGQLRKILTAKMIRFAEEYIIDYCGQDSYFRAGYSCKKKTVAKSNAYKLLTNAYLQRYISILQEEQSKRTGVTADKVIEELERIGFVDIKDYVSFRTEKTVVGEIDGIAILGYDTVVDMKDSTEVDGKVISEISKGKDGFKFKLHSKVDALGKIMDHLGMKKRNVNIKGLDQLQLPQTKVYVIPNLVDLPEDLKPLIIIKDEKIVKPAVEEKKK